MKRRVGPRARSDEPLCTASSLKVRSMGNPERLRLRPHVLDSKSDGRGLSCAAERRSRSAGRLSTLIASQGGVPNSSSATMASN